VAPPSTNRFPLLSGRLPWRSRKAGETLAKLTWSIDHYDLPDWAERIGRSTLVIIDEAGMADTLSLDTAVQFVIGRGGSVRLVGDDHLNNSLRSALAGCFATSKPAMARSG
jgi:hypothetical protein